MAEESSVSDQLKEVVTKLKATIDPGRGDVIAAGRKALRLTVKEKLYSRQGLINWLKLEEEKNKERFNSKLFTETMQSPLNVPVVPALYEPDAKMLAGREV